MEAASLIDMLQNVVAKELAKMRRAREIVLAREYLKLLEQGYDAKDLAIYHKASFPEMREDHMGMVCSYTEKVWLAPKKAIGEYIEEPRES